ncbi:Tmem171 [Columba guinea]|nr:Tmem171 [Columba guinea]
MQHANLKKLGQEGFGQFLQPYNFLMITVLASQRSLSLFACAFCCFEPTGIVVGSFFMECSSVWHSGMLISILGIWVPGCSPSWHSIQLNYTSSSDVDLQGCGFLSLQIMGPLIVLTGLCFFVIAHVKKKQNLNLNQESCESEEHPQSPESFQVTVGDAVMVFPPPPPPYFADPLSPTVTRCLMSGGLPTSDNPPPYHSIFSDGAQLADDERAVAVRDYETIYTISGSGSPSDVSPILYVSSESPPKYEEKASITNNEYSSSSSSSSSSISLATSDSSS